jgi:phosphatidylglycerol:prolipoprotein diacylglycerol transferase
MHPVLFRIPGLDFPVRSFGVLVAVGFLVGAWLWSRLLARHGQDPKKDVERANDVAMWVLIGVLAGARLLYVVVEAARYLGADTTPAMEEYLASSDRPASAAHLSADHADELARARPLATGYDFLHRPAEILYVWRGGLVMYGGFAGAVVLGLWASKRKGLDVLNAFDTGIVAGFLGQAIGRVGCLLVGDDYGGIVPERYASLPFPITLRVPSRAWLESHPESLFDHDLAGQVLWATQPWMSLNALIVMAVAWGVLGRRRWYGQAAAAGVIAYSVGRFSIEAFRGDSVRGLWFGGAISTSQLISIPVFLLALAWLLKNARRDDRPFSTRAPRG